MKEEDERRFPKTEAILAPVAASQDAAAERANRADARMGPGLKPAWKDGRPIEPRRSLAWTRPMPVRSNWAVRFE
jgi:hypothetical protein